MSQTSQQQISLPTGKWQIFGDHEQGELVITSVDPNGNFKGTVFGDEIIAGAFHAASGEISFSRRIKSLPDTQTYTGYISVINIVVDVTNYLLGGYYKRAPLGIGHRFGWYATISKPIVRPK